jgi:phosphatidylethanolamine/phosphatidyl-N-methylethanolamine N-methyltransferase
MMLAFARPTMVGALLPSSRALAQAMAQAADGARLVVELGAGTGAITAGLVERHPDVPTVAVELQEEMAQMLAERFAHVDVRAASAHRVLRDLPPTCEDVAVVSSLPFRSLPRRWSEPTSRAIEQFLQGGARRWLVQYTYQPAVPFDLSGSDRLRWQRSRFVWRNAPPAWVWTLAARD